jgi:acyl-CoA synthetase (AMP-forming)/AMP-acid ligase II
MSLSVLLEMAVTAHGERIALGGRQDGLTFDDLGQRAQGGASVIKAHAAGHVVMLARNGPVMPQLLFAAAAAGVPFTPMNYRLTEQQIRRLVARLDHPLIVADDDYAASVAGLDSMSTASFCRQAADAPRAEPVPADGDAVAVMLFTSGTTSEPKLVPLRHENLMSYVLSTVEFGAADAADAALVTVPPYHIAAVSSVLSNAHAGRRVVYLPDFDPGRWLELVADEAITSAMVVPTMLARIMERISAPTDQGGLGGRPPRLAALRSIAYGGARMPRPVLEQALDALPACDFVNAYGLTETSSTIALLGPEDHRAAFAADDPIVRARLGSVGRPVPGIEIDIRDVDGRTVAAGQQGELWVRGPQVVDEYSGSGSAVDDDNWFPTRDLARVDADGYLFIDGRADDIVIRGGENISPAEVEDVLIEHPSVAEAAVVGVPDDEWGERLVAVVVAGRPLTTDHTAEVREFVRSRLRGSRTPDVILWRDELPYTPTGKLLRRDVAREARSLLASCRDDT